jgi:hypothetical protein
MTGNTHTDLKALLAPTAGEGMMSIQGHLRKLTDRAEDLGAEHKAELEKAIAKAEQAADRQPAASTTSRSRRRAKRPVPTCRV